MQSKTGLTAMLIVIFTARFISVIRHTLSIPRHAKCHCVHLRPIPWPQWFSGRFYFYFSGWSWEYIGRAQSTFKKWPWLFGADYNTSFKCFACILYTKDFNCKICVEKEKIIYKKNTEILYPNKKNFCMIWI